MQVEAEGAGGERGREDEEEERREGPVVAAMAGGSWERRGDRSREGNGKEALRQRPTD